MSGLRAVANTERNDTLQADTGATLTTDELAASQAGYRARPDAEKLEHGPLFYRWHKTLRPFAFVTADDLLLDLCHPHAKAALPDVSHHFRRRFPSS